MKQTTLSNPNSQSTPNQNPKLPQAVSDDLERILDYLWKDEAADYLDTSQALPRDGHIFLALQNVRAWLQGG